MAGELIELGPVSRAEIERERAAADCPFCKRIAAGEYDYGNISNVAFEPLSPVTPGHFLVVPRNHVTSALASPSRAASALAFAAHLARQEMGLEACNFITSVGAEATQSVYHLHIHIVPRQAGDGLLLPWGGQGERYRKAAEAR